MLDMNANLIKTRSLHPDTQILKEDKLHVTDITDVKLHCGYNRWFYRIGSVHSWGTCLGQMSN